MQMLASLFDRLTDYAPGTSREVPPPEGEQLREYNASVARDLTNLLNTRRSETDIPIQFEQSRESLAAYGVADFATAPMRSEIIERAIEQAIRLFEPRLSRVQVTVAPSDNLNFSCRISGMLRVAVGAVPVVYDAEMPVESRRFQVKVRR
jgi:type VI secretion system lysozyme-like protein